MQQILAAPEARERLVQSFYREYLARTPETAGLETWANGLLNGMREEDVRAAFLASDEFHTLHLRRPVP